MIIVEKKSGLTILWDFDGTLFDTYPVYTTIFKKVLNDEYIDRNEIFRHLKVSFGHASSYYKITKEQLKEFFYWKKKYRRKK